MSCHAWMSLDVTVTDRDYEENARQFANDKGRETQGHFGADETHLSLDGELVVSSEWEASYFDREIGYLQDYLNEFPVPVDAWKAHVRYEYLDEPNTDGTIVEFVIENGVVSSFQESRIVMVETAPWFDIDMASRDA